MPLPIVGTILRKTDTLFRHSVTHRTAEFSMSGHVTDCPQHPARAADSVTPEIPPSGHPRRHEEADVPHSQDGNGERKRPCLVEVSPTVTKSHTTNPGHGLCVHELKIYDLGPAQLPYIFPDTFVIHCAFAMCRRAANLIPTGHSHNTLPMLMPTPPTCMRILHTQHSHHRLSHPPQQYCIHSRM